MKEGGAGRGKGGQSYGWREGWEARGGQTYGWREELEGGEKMGKTDIDYIVEIRKEEFLKNTKNCVFENELSGNIRILLFYSLYILY